ncbi:hypothetical protein PCK2_000748 [Pneumocystis canis]|nr:hypothetical protein PCK2_000748 [Pneumocystis canis]
METKHLEHSLSQKSYIPPYIKRTTRISIRFPTTYFSFIHLINKIKHFKRKTDFSKNTFSTTLGKTMISGRFQKRSEINSMAQCIYQRNFIQLHDAFTFSNRTCSSYSSLPDSCISSLVENSDAIYKIYAYNKTNNSASKWKSQCKHVYDACSISFSILNNFSILTFIFITIGTYIFI